MNTNNALAFTLTELVVVITIIGILSIMAIIGYSGFSESARDAVRLSHISTISQTLEEYAKKNAHYPSPDNAASITWSGSVAWYQGTVGDAFAATIKLSPKLTDPSYGVEYAYSITTSGKQYQLAAIYEGGSIADSGNPFPQAVAAAPSGAIVRGTYNQVLTPVSGPNGTTSFIAIPSIILSDLSKTDLSLSGTFSTGAFVIDKRKNFPMSYSGSVTKASGDFYFMPKLLWTTTGSLSSTDLAVLMEQVKLAYSGSVLATSTGNTIWNTVAASASGSDVQTAMAKGIFWAISGGSYVIAPAGPMITVCSANTVTQVWTYNAASNTCVSTCLNGYSGSNCTTVGAYSSGIVYVPGLQFTYSGGTITVTGTGVWSSNTKVSGCNTNDIAIWSGSYIQIWAACNMGATNAWTGPVFASASAARDATVNSWAGGFYQWGNNAEISYASTASGQVGCTNTPNSFSGATFRTPNTDWCTTQSDDLWGNTTNTNVARQGPCPANYHVPTQYEWWQGLNTINSALTNTSSWQNDTSVANVLKLPLAGLRDYSTAAYSVQGTYGYYRSSSPNSATAFYVLFSGTQVFPYTSQNKAYGFSVRCLRN